MAEFVEFTRTDGDKILLNVHHIVKIYPGKDGTYIYFDVVSGGKDSISFAREFVTEDYSVIRKKLQQ